jgi:hypothetical protein
VSGVVVTAVVALAGGVAGFGVAWWSFRPAAVAPPEPEAAPEPWTPTVATDECGTWLQGLTDLDREFYMALAAEDDAGGAR